MDQSTQHLVHPFVEKTQCQVHTPTSGGEYVLTKLDHVCTKESQGFSCRLSAAKKTISLLLEAAAPSP
jgi:hypothetical protein